MSGNRAISTLDHHEWSADPLERLAELRGARDYIDWLIERAVVECRTNATQHYEDVVGDETREASTAKPIPWRVIGAQLGISKSVANLRYRGLADDEDRSAER